jgi:hypothetical protein
LVCFLVEQLSIETELFVRPNCMQNIPERVKAYIGLHSFPAHNGHPQTKPSASCSRGVKMSKGATTKDTAFKVPVFCRLTSDIKECGVLYIGKLYRENTILLCDHLST